MQLLKILKPLPILIVNFYETSRILADQLIGRYKGFLSGGELGNLKQQFPIYLPIYDHSQGLTARIDLCSICLSSFKCKIFQT